MQTDPFLQAAPQPDAREPQRDRRPWLRIVWLVVSLLVITGLAWLDNISGPDFAFALFYLVPVVAMAWWQGTRNGLVVALAASMGWSLVAFVGGYVQGSIINSWNSLSRLIIFTGAAILIGSLREGRDRLMRMAEREAELARLDPLTQLPNWRAFEDHLSLAVARCARASCPLGIGYVDLDNFKRVNDLHGHEAGNKLLRRIATILRETLRGQDVVARVGGDEFVLLFDCPEPERATRIGERLIGAIEALDHERTEAGLGASIGIVVVSSPGAWRARVADLLQMADQAMYRAKAAGKGRVEAIVVEGPPEE